MSGSGAAAGGVSRKLSVFIVGGTGEVGKALVKELARNHGHFDKVTLIGRRTIDLPKDETYGSFTQTQIDFEKIPEFASAFQGFDIGICALGTTRGKAGKDGFYRVDHDYILGVAQQAKAAGVSQFHLVSSAGASKDSYFFYPKVKGQVEEEVKGLEFDRVSIYRPSVLIVDRVESRPFEKFAITMTKHLDYWRKFSIDVPLLAKAIVKNILVAPTAKVELLDNGMLNSIGKD